MLVDQNGAHKGALGRGEHKSIQTDRVILVPGAPVEIETVQWMYRAFVEEGKLEQDIADLSTAGTCRQRMAAPGREDASTRC